MTDSVAVGVGGVVLACCAVALAWLLRRALVPGGAVSASIVAGISVGLLAGPDGFGRVQPAAYRQAFQGGAAEFDAVRSDEIRRVQEMLALRASGASPAAIDEHRAAQDLETQPLLSAWRAARAERRHALDLATLIACGLYLILMAPSLIPRVRGVRRVLRSAARIGPRLLACAWIASALACIPPMIVCGYFTHASLPLIALFGLAIGAPGLSAVLKPGTWIASTLAMLACAMIALLLAWNLGLTILGGSLLLGLMLAIGLGESARSLRIRRLARSIAVGAVLPVATALAAQQVDLLLLTSSSAGAFWCAVIVALIWSSDGRLFAWFVTWRLAGPTEAQGAPWRAAASCVGPGAGAATLMLTVAATSGHAAEMIRQVQSLIPLQVLLAGGLLAAALVEVMLGARRWIARTLDAAR